MTIFDTRLGKSGEGVITDSRGTEHVNPDREAAERLARDVDVQANRHSVRGRRGAVCPDGSGKLCVTCRMPPAECARYMDFLDSRASQERRRQVADRRRAMEISGAYSPRES